MRQLDAFLPRTRIAYLSMEIALRPEIHTYSGGLGVLAGDTVRSSADLELPIVFVTMASRNGYFRQEIDAHGHQVEWPDPWDVAGLTSMVPAMVAVEIQGRPVWIRPWLYVHTSARGYSVPVLLLDTDLEQNDPADRPLTDRLYGGDHAYRLKQELVLGVGGARMLRALGFEPDIYHLNEGHAAFLPVELLRRMRRMRGQSGNGSAGSDRAGSDRARARDMCIFTTHTPVEAGHDRFPYDLVEHVTADLIPIAELKELAGSDGLNMTRLALNLSGYVNGVARRHATTTRDMFPGYAVDSITNGIHTTTWAHPAFAALFDAAIPHWVVEPEVLSHADTLDDGKVRDAHHVAKTDLVRLVRERTGVEFDPALPVIGYARRMTGYKRPDLLFSDIERLERLAREQPFQLVMAGKAHPNDHSGRAFIAGLHELQRRLYGVLPLAFLPNYDMAMAKTLIAGPDIWLNTPLPPLEASGTSGMKAALNGVLNLSTLDGWWIEGCIEGVTGWGIEAAPGGRAGGEDDGDALYAKLGGTVLPLYARDPKRWTWMMKQSIAKIGSYFSSHRMMRYYVTQAYMR